MTGRGPGPGWPTVLGLALVVLMLSVFHPLQLLMVPLALLLIALPPRSPVALALAIVLLALTFLGPHGPLWNVERGWALLLAGWFVVAVVARPAASFLSRALAATAATVVSGGAIIALTGGWAALDWRIATRYREVAETMRQAWPGRLSDADVVIEQAARLPAQLFPALLAISSVAALAVGWWGFCRIGGRRGRPLGRLPEFSFPDVLVWVLIAGVALVVAPVFGAAADWVPRVGSNLVLFMGALYALRGIAVVVALVGPHAVALVVLAVVGLILYPIVMAGSLVVGVTDTWLDLRSSLSGANDEGGGVER